MVEQTALPPSVREVAETLARLGAVFFGAAYVVGFLILNVQLGAYGVIELSFAQPRYVLVGALWMLLVASAYYSVFFAVA